MARPRGGTPSPRTCQVSFERHQWIHRIRDWAKESCVTCVESTRLTHHTNISLGFTHRWSMCMRMRMRSMRIDTGACAACSREKEKEDGFFPFSM